MIFLCRSNFLYFHAVFGINWPNNRLAPPFWICYLSFGNAGSATAFTCISVVLLILPLLQTYNQRMPVATRVRCRSFPVTAPDLWTNIKTGASRPHHPCPPPRTEMAVVMTTRITTTTINVMVVGGVIVATTTFTSGSQSNRSSAVVGLPRKIPGAPPPVTGPNFFDYMGIYF